MSDTVMKAIDAGAYFVDHGSIVRRARNARGEAKVIELANFAARIIGEEIHDDGSDVRIFYVVKGEAAGKPLPTVRVAATDFAAMNWVAASWGSRARILPGAKQHLANAIQALSVDVPRRKVFGHLGWRRRSGKSIYLHAGGAIGPDGPASKVRVDVPPELAPFNLPPPPSDDRLQQAVDASLALLSIAPDRVTFPLLGAVYRAALGSAQFSVFLVGTSGVRKPELAAQAQSHWGSKMSSGRDLPADWLSTGAALEMMAFTAKDALLVIDDFAPSTDPTRSRAIAGAAEHVFRAQGNQAARFRASPGGRLVHGRPPRGLILSTGEDLPAGTSIRARLIAVEVAAGDVSLDRLTDAQARAASGLHAGAMSAFVRWLATRRKFAAKKLRASIAVWRSDMSGHGRHVDALAELHAGLLLFIRFARSSNAISKDESSNLLKRARRAFRIVALRQGMPARSTDPLARFVDSLVRALSCGQAHLNDLETNRRVPLHVLGIGKRSKMRTRTSLLVGWTRGEHLLLEPQAAVRAATAADEALGVDARKLKSMLEERSLLHAREDDHRSTRARIGGQRRRVVQVDLDLIRAGTPTFERLGPAVR